MPSFSAHTLRDLAETCRVSKMTVSRALRGLPGVSAEVAQRIRAAAADRGYRSDPALSSTMSRLRRSGPIYRETLGFIWTHHASHDPGGPGGLGTWRDAARERAEQLGFKLDEFSLKAPGVTSARLRAILQTRGVRGLLFAPDVERPFPRVPFDVRSFAAVLLGSSLYNRGLSRVQFDHFQSVHLALRQMRKAGFERPGFLLSPSFDGRTQGRARASFLAHAPGPIADRARRLYLGDTSDRPGIAAWLERARPDALLALDDPRPMLRALGWRVPQDLALVSHSRRGAHAALAGVEESATALGHTAVDLLVAQLQRGEFGRLPFPQRVTIDAQWIPGATLPSRRQQPATSRRASRLSPKS